MDRDPPARWGHSAVILNARVYVWSGCTTETPNECYSNSKIKQKLLKKVFICDIAGSRWIESDAEGSPPRAVRGSGYTTNTKDKIFSFGGYCGHHYHWYNDLHELQIQQYTSSLEWLRIEPLSEKETLPTCKQDCGMVYFSEGDQLCIFGGAGLLKGHQKWSVCDELHVFNISTRSWEIPAATGSKPPPSSGFSLTVINDHQAVLFGGRGNDNRLLGSVYRLTAGKWMWEKIPITLCSPEKLPIARESHSSVLIKNSLFVIGGLDDKENSISDSWLFNLSNYTWSKIILPNEVTQMISGIAVCELIDNIYHLVSYGGLSDSLDRKKLHKEQKMNTTTVVTLIDQDTVSMKYWYNFTLMGCQIKDLFKEIEILKVENNKLKGEVSTQTRANLHKQVSEPIQLSSNSEWIDRVDDHTLNIEDLDSVLKALKDINNWQSLGLSLGLHKPTLDTIARSCKGTYESKMEMMSSWLRQVDNVGSPSWKSLVRSVYIENKSLAKQIASEHFKLDRAMSIA